MNPVITSPSRVRSPSSFVRSISGSHRPSTARRISPSSRSGGTSSKRHSSQKRTSEIFRSPRSYPATDVGRNRSADASARSLRVIPRASRARRSARPISRAMDDLIVSGPRSARSRGEAHCSPQYRCRARPSRAADAVGFLPNGRDSRGRTSQNALRVPSGGKFAPKKISGGGTSPLRRDARMFLHRSVAKNAFRVVGLPLRSSG
jgi:hypothetical protein